MNESENPILVRWRTWPLLRKVQLVGPTMAALITISLPIAVVFYMRNAQGHGGAGAQLLAMALGLTHLPTALLFKAFGSTLPFEGTVGRESSWVLPTLFAGVVNAVVIFVIVTIIAWVIKTIQTAEG